MNYGTTVPGQAFTLGGRVSFTTDGTLADPYLTVGCTVASISGCTQGPGFVAVGAPTSSPAALLPGVSSGFTFTGGLGTDFASMSVAAGPTSIAPPVSGGPTWLGAQGAALETTVADYGQLTINYSGAAPPPASVNVDMNYALSGVVHDTSTNVSGTYSAGVDSFSQVVDATTLQPSGVFLQGQGWSVSGSAGPLYGAGNSTTTAGTAVLPLVPNRLYIVVNQASALLYFTSGGNYDGLSLSEYGVADPTFLIDPAWLSANPQYSASDFSFSEVYESPVPLPAAAWLLLSGLGGLGAIARRRRLPLNRP